MSHFFCLAAREGGEDKNSSSPTHTMNKQARSRKFSSKQSARLGAYLATGVAASMGVSSDAEAAIIFFDVDPDITLTVYGSSYVTFGNINLSTGTYDLNYFGGLRTTLSLNGSGWSTFGDLQFAIAPSTSAALRLNYGDVHFSPPVYNWASSVGSYGAWASGGSGYLGVITGGGGVENWNFGWMALNYLAAGDASTLTISGFAFESVPGTPIIAGQGGPGPAAIPEPGTWAAAALLAGGAAFARWRKRRNEAQKEAV
jgi:hypothetical protein